MGSRLALCCGSWATRVDVTQRAWDARQTHLAFYFARVKGMEWDDALIAASRQTERERGPRPQEPHGPGLLGTIKLGLGLLFRREETMLNLWTTAKKAGIQALVIILGALIAAVSAPDTVQQVSDALKDIPLVGGSLGVAVCGALAVAFTNIVKRLNAIRKANKA